MKKFIIPTVALLALLILGGCGSYSTNQNSTPPAKPSSPSSGQQTPSENSPNSVNIQSFAFNPGILTIKKGTTVTWTNNDSAPHQIKSATFNSNEISKGQSFSFTFNEAGTFDYSCAIHPSMLGKVIVE